LASTESIGKSSQNRDLLILKLGVNHQSNNKPVIWIDGGIHAREWISPATVLYFIQTLVDGVKNNDATIVKLVNTYDWYFLPVANPDGYEYTHTNVSVR
jgi:murein tripeptide amidase MpaA